MAGNHKVKQGRGQNTRKSNKWKIQNQSRRDHSQYQKVRSTFNIKERPKTLIRVEIKQGGGVTGQKTKRPDYNKQKIQIQDLQTTHRNTGTYRINRNQESQLNRAGIRITKTQKTNSQGATERCRLNTPGNKTFYAGFWK